MTMLDESRSGSKAIADRDSRRRRRPRSHTSNITNTGRRRPSAMLHKDSYGTALDIAPPPLTMPAETNPKTTRD